MKIRNPCLVILITLINLLCSQSSQAYSILTHEAIVDASWEKGLQPLLLLKYPGSTNEQLKEAHSYAYGGAIAPDMGYFPFGNPLFTNLVHYVRSGDFVNNLLDEAQNLNEYAFALGCLSHYMSDKYGHNLGTNRCVPMVYPKIKKKFGSVVTYDEDHTSHKRMEFAFDVLQTALGNYATPKYHDFISFNVARPVLERAFSLTYGLDINEVFGDLSLAISTFRWSVMSLFPTLTKTAWAMKKNEIRKMQPNSTSRNFKFKMKRAIYYKEFGNKIQKPGFFPTILSWFICILPKVGPLKSLKYIPPGPAAEKLFIQSFDAVLVHYSSSLETLHHGNIYFTNIDFDTGNITEPGEYPLTDRTYDVLVTRLENKNFDLLNPDLKQNILRFYTNRKPLLHTKKYERNFEKTTEALEQLKCTATKLQYRASMDMKQNGKRTRL
jgi:hypothetical protein